MLGREPVFGNPGSQPATLMIRVMGARAPKQPPLLSPISQEPGEDKVLRLEDALRRSEKLALIGRWTASIMHEINGPAEALTNLVFLIEQNAADVELVKALSRQAEEQLARLRYAARQTLSYFRDSPQRQNTDLVALVETAIRFHKPALARKRIDLRKRLPPSLVAPVYPGDILQLLANLLGNAIDAIEDSGALCIRLRSGAGKIRITIADSGCGIPASLRPLLFEPFRSSKANSGNGLGLWICKTIAEKHQGRIAWRSSTANPGHGTTFSVLLAS